MFLDEYSSRCVECRLGSVFLDSFSCHSKQCSLFGSQSIVKENFTLTFVLTLFFHHPSFDSSRRENNHKDLAAVADGSRISMMYVAEFECNVETGDQTMSEGMKVAFVGFNIGDRYTCDVHVSCEGRLFDVV